MTLFFCLSVSLFVCLSANTITPEPLEISSRNFRDIIPGSKGRLLSSKMAMEDGRTADGLTSAVLLCKVGSPWRMTVKELTRVRQHLRCFSLVSQLN